MRLVTYLSADRSMRIGALANLGSSMSDRVVDLTDAAEGIRCLRELIGRWDRLGPGLAERLRTGSLPEVGPLGQVALAPPIPRPHKVVCIGLNYADHAAETGAPIPTEPVVFNKFPTAIIGPGAAIELPEISSQVDYEAELVVVIGKAASRIDRSTAMDHVFGYMCGHDVSARDWQKGRPGGQWLLGKTFDTFGPTGPFLATKDEIPDPHALDVRFRLNGRELQSSNTRQFIFPIDQLIAHLSNVFTLEPGDLLFTGTPPGVGTARKPPVYLQPGDTAEVEIDGLGVLVNPVVSRPAK